MFDRAAWLEILTEMLAEKRLHHSLCVEKRCVELAEIHGADTQKAAAAGLLHDVFHDMPKDEQLKYIRSRGILLDIFSAQHPPLWHSIAGAEFLREKAFDDEQVILAVRYHTTGRGGMSLLEKVVFLADATSSERSYPGVEEMRSLADSNLDEAMLKSLTRELGRLLEKGLTITKDAWEAYNYFADICTTG